SCQPADAGEHHRIAAYERVGKTVFSMKVVCSVAAYSIKLLFMGFWTSPMSNPVFFRSEG
ncbi:MAG: hypothetical protein VW870_07525, partial [Rhodobiaceae bacterium]